jgi:hypothetical protein
MAKKTIEIFGRRFGVVEDTVGSSCNMCALQDFCDKVNEMILQTGTDWGYPTICQSKSGHDRHFVFLPNS